MSANRQNIASKVIKLFSYGLHLVKQHSDNLDSDEKAFRKMFQRRGEDIGIYKDKDKSCLIFKKK